MFVVYGKSSCLLTTLPCFCVLTAPSTRWAPCAKMRFLSATRQWDSKNNWLVGEHVTIHMSPVTIVYQIEPANWKKDIIFLLNGRMKRAKIELNHTKYNTVYIYSSSKHTHNTLTHTHAYGQTKKSRRIWKHVLKPYDNRGLKCVVSVS